MEENMNNIIGSFSYTKFDGITRIYDVDTNSKYVFGNNPIFDTSSKMQVNVQLQKIIQNSNGEIYFIMDFTILNNKNNYGLEFLAQKYISAMDNISKIQDHLILQINQYGEIIDIINFSELYDKWLAYKSEICKNNVFNETELKKIVSEGDKEYEDGSMHFAKGLNKITLYRGLMRGFIAFDRIKNKKGFYKFNSTSLLFADIDIPIDVYKTETLPFSGEPTYLQLFQGQSDEYESKIRNQCIKSFPFVKDKLGKYAYNLIYSVEKDKTTEWPTEIELSMKETLELIYSEINCNIKLIKK